MATVTFNVMAWAAMAMVMAAAMVTVIGIVAVMVIAMSRPCKPCEAMWH